MKNLVHRYSHGQISRASIPLNIDQEHNLSNLFNVKQVKLLI